MVSNPFIYKLKNIPVWHIAIIILLPLIVYFKTINFDFLSLDDKDIILNHYDTIGNINNIGEAFNRDAFLSKNGDTFYRPVQTVSFMLDAIVSGENPWMYHFTNIIILIATCISLYFFLKLLKFQNITAFFIALIFSVHPLLTDTVAVVASRGDLLIGLLGLLLLISFFKHFITGKPVYFLLHSLFFTLIIFTKESSIVFPLILLSFFFFELKDKYIYKKLFPYFIVWFTVSVIFLIIRRIVLTGVKPSGNVFGIIPFIKDIPTIPTIIGKFFIPVNLSPMPLYDNISIIIGTILTLILIIPVVKNIIKKKWIVLIGLIWFLIFIIPSLFYRIANAEYILTYSEHRMYLPVIGLFIIIAFWLNEYISKFNNYISGILFILILIIFTSATYNHTNCYKDSFTFYSSVINVNSNNAFAYTNRGIEFYKKNDIQNALKDYNKSIEIFPNSFTYIDRGLIDTKMQNYYAAEKDYTAAIALDPLSEIAYFNRASIREHLMNYKSALQDLQHAAKLDRNNFKIFYNAGNIYMAVKDYKSAINNFSIALDIQPNFIDALNNRIIARYNIKDYNGIIEDCNKLVQLNYDLENTYNNMGIAYLNLVKYDEAIDCFNKTININKNFATAYYNRGLAKEKKNDITGARDDWEKALKLGSPEAGVMLNKK